MRWFASLLLLFALSTPAPAAENIVILLDTSGSMDHSMSRGGLTKIKAAYNAVESVVEQLPPTTNIGVLGFEGWIQPFGPLDVATLRNKLLHVEPNGGTPLGEYLETAGVALLSVRERAKGIGVFRLIVVTDGLADDSTSTQRNALQIASRGVILDTIGVDMQQDHPLSVVSRKYMRADDPASFQNAMQVVMAEIGTSDVDRDGYDLLKLLPDGSAPRVIGALKQGLDSNGPLSSNSAVSLSSNLSTTELTAVFVVGIGLVVLIFFGAILLSRT